MHDGLLSVGLDVGTTSTQLVVSRLQVENKAGAFAVPEMVISRRQILYRSPVRFTPMVDGQRVDAPALRKMVDADYARAGIRREDVDTGAIIITGETSRKENAAAVLAELAGYAGEFVVAAAGPDLESVLAAKGAGAVQWSEETGKTVLHMDIGGGTSNLALIRKGEICATGCLNVGGRLVKLSGDGAVTYVSPVLAGCWDLTVGGTPQREELAQLCRMLTRALEMAAGLRGRTQLLDMLQTRESAMEWIPPEEPCVLSFSGGVADCVERDVPDLEFGDLGPMLGRCIRESLLCRGQYRLGAETIRATVIGAGCHSARLSGSTVFHRGICFPLKNLPVICMEQPERTAIRDALRRQEGPAVLALPGQKAADYRTLRAWAEEIAAGFDGEILVCLQRDMAKALGQLLALMTPRPVLCIDGVKLTRESFLDVGMPLGPAVPVVVKTLVLEKQRG